MSLKLLLHWKEKLQEWCNTIHIFTVILICFINVTSSAALNLRIIPTSCLSQMSKSKCSHNSSRWKEIWLNLKQMWVWTWRRNNNIGLLLHPWCCVSTKTVSMQMNGGSPADWALLNSYWLVTKPVTYPNLMVIWPKTRCIMLNSVIHARPFRWSFLRSFKRPTTWRMLNIPAKQRAYKHTEASEPNTSVHRGRSVQVGHSASVSVSLDHMGVCCSAHTKHVWMKLSVFPGEGVAFHWLLNTHTHTIGWAAL